MAHTPGWKIALTWLSIFLIIYVFVKAVTLDFPSVDDAAIKGSPLQEGSFRERCPHTVQGNVNATLTLRYFDSPYCPWCRLEEPILKKMLQEKGDLFQVQRYDVRYCSREVRQYHVAGTPTFVFLQDNETVPVIRPGYQTEAQLTDVICGLSGGC